jgi:hypothetical protein
MTRSATSRRALLRRGGAAVAAGASASVAGCSALDLDIDGSPDVPFFTTWAPAPERVFLDPNETEADEAMLRYYPFRTRSFDELTEFAAARNETVTTRYEDGHVHPVLDVTPAETYFEFRSNRGLSVLETELLEDDIVAAFEAYEDPTGTFEITGEYEGFTLLTFTGGEWAVGVHAGVVVEAFTALGTGGPLLREKRAVVAAIVDARAGQGRYVAVDEPLRTLVNRLGPAATVEVTSYDGAGSDSAPLAAGTASGIDGDATAARRVLVFATQADAKANRADPRDDEVADWNDVSVRREGRVVVVTGRR